MKKIVNKSMLLISAFFAFTACDDVFEEDITNDIVTTISPENEAVLEGNSVQFRWQELEGADEYRIQVIEVVSQASVLDSLVTGDKFTYGFIPGKYNWRIRAENFAYTTSYGFPSSFDLKSTNDLKLQTLFLTSPSDNFYTNKNNLILTWDKIIAASSYNLVIDKTIQGNTATEIQITDITDTSYTLNSTVMSEDAIYTWKVKAQNENSETEFSTRKILLDSQIPIVPIATSPQDDSVTSSIVNFTWNVGSDSGEVQSELSNVLEIATDSGFATIIQLIKTSLSSQQVEFTETGLYYWRIKTVDAAGNESVYNEIREFTVQ